MTKRYDNKNASNFDFKLPSNITVTQQPLPNGMAYVFRDIELGELGKLEVEIAPTGETRITSTVTGFPDDPMTQRRLKVLEPICKALTGILEASCGKGHTEPLPTSEPKIVGQMPCEEVRCKVCGTIVAFLIFAGDATDPGYFEDYSRLMYPHYVRHNVLTYIIGPETEYRPGNILKVWPERGPFECLSPAEFNPRISKLVTKHCL